MKTRRVIVKILQTGKGTTDYYSTFSYPETAMTFKVDARQDDDPVSCTVRIMGVSKNTYGYFSTTNKDKYFSSQKIEVYYGYDDDMSLVFTGGIERAMYAFENGAQTLIIMATRNKRAFGNMVKPISISGKQSLKQALDIIAEQYGYTIKYGDKVFESISSGRFCFTGTIREALKSILPKWYGYHVYDKEVYVYHIDKSVPNEITLWFENGLLNYPTEDTKQENTTIRSTLLPSVEFGTKINIPVDDIWFADYDTGTYKTFVVKTFESSFENGIGVTTMECEGGVGL